MANKISNSIVLSGHSKVSRTRHLLALVNFIAVLLGTAITLFFLTKRGCSNGMLVIMYLILVLNVMQVALCVVDFVLKWTKGIYIKWLPLVSYGIAGLWVVAVLGEMIAGTSELGELRTDLLIVLIVQFVVAMVAYVVWPMLDRRAIGAMTAKKVRDNDVAKNKKAKGYVIKYAVICGAIVLLQVCALLIYKLPPRLYDLFDESRAIKYVTNEAGDGYIVQDVYRGTSSYLNIPAEYNGKPVIGIAEGAIDQTEIIDRYKIDEIVFGTVTVDENGNEVLVSNLQYIESGAIKNDKITSILLPNSIGFIGENAISSTSLQTVTYESKADFDISAFSTPALTTIVMQGDDVGKIASLNGMASTVNIEVDKEIYNEYRKANIEYESNFSPILPSDEFYVDFFTDCGYYLDSIFGKKGEKISLTVSDLKNANLGGNGLVEDTRAYIVDNKEMNTPGAKDGYAFRGWYYVPEFTKDEECVFVETSAVELSGNTKLYAKWVKEYHGALNWGHTPSGVDEEIWWTEEDDYSLPNYLERAGYDEGVEWFTGDTDEQIQHTSELEIDRNVDFRAEWQLDAPQIDIIPSIDYINNSSNSSDYDESLSRDSVTVTYDENHAIKLDLQTNHDLGNANVDYDWVWSWDNGAIESDGAEDLTVKNVMQSGTYTLTVTAKAKQGGEESEAQTSISVTVKKKDLTLEGIDFNRNDNEVEYNSNNQKFEVDGDTNGLKITYTYYDYSSDEVGAAKGDNDGVRNAGKYWVKADFAKINPNEAENYKTNTLEAEFIINKATISGTEWQGDLSTTYDKTDKRVSLVMYGKKGMDDVGFEYQSNTAKDAGSYTATVIGLIGNDKDNYQFDFNNAQCEWSILKREVTVRHWELDNSDNSSVITGAATTEYNGKEQSVAAIMSTNVCDGDTVNFVYGSNGKRSAINANSYEAVITGVTNDNYFFDTSATNAKLQWSITRRQLNVGFSGGNLTYNASEQGVTATIFNFANGEAESFDTTKFMYGASTASVQKGQSADSTQMVLNFTKTDAGSYKAEIVGTELTNYTIVGGSCDFTIAPKPINFSLVGNDASAYATYNGAKQQAKWTIDDFAESDLSNINSSLFGITLGGYTTSFDGSRSGDSYTITVDLSDAATYAGEYVVDFVSFTHNNYVIAQDATTQYNLTVNKAPITAKWYITANVEGGRIETLSPNASKTYNGRNNGYTVSVEPSGLFGSDSVALNLSDATQTVVGSNYTTTVSLAEHDNYTLTGDNSISWSIVPKEVSLVWKLDGENQADKKAATVTYNATEHTVEAIIEQGLCGGDQPVVVTSYDDNGDAKNKGIYIVSAVTISDGNYIINKDTETFTLTINAKTISLKEDWMYKVEGEEGNVYTDALEYKNSNYTVYTEVKDGLCSGDSITLDYTEATGKNAGTYTTTVSLSEDSNYVLDDTYTFGWEIAPKKITGISSSGNSVFTFKNGEYVYDPSITFEGAIDTYPVEYTLSDNAETAVGKYVATLKINDPNYILADGADNLLEWEITKRAHDDGTEIAFVNEFTYDGTTHIPQIIITLDGVELSKATDYEYEIKKNGSMADPIDAGTYTITVTKLDNECFYLSEGGLSRAFTIKQREITEDDIQWTFNTIEYNGGIQYPTASIKFADVEIDTYSYVNSVAAGGYEITATAVNNSNYILGDIEPHKYTISKKVIDKLDWTNTTVTYNGGEQKPTATYTFNGEGATETVTVTTMSFNKTPKNAADDYIATAEEVNNTNFTLASNLTHSFTIKEVEIRVGELVWGNTEFEYNGSAQKPTATYTFNGEGGTERVTVDVTVVEWGTAKNAGSYTATATGVNSTNFKLVGTHEKPFTINRHKITSFTWTNTTVTYNGSAQKPTATYTFNGETVKAIVTVEGGSAIDAKEGYTAKVTGVDKVDNFEFGDNFTSNLTCENFTITPAIINQLSWDYKELTYDGTARYPTASTNIAGVTVTDYTMEESINVRTGYTITAKGVSNLNYKLPDDGISYHYDIIPMTVTRLTWEVEEYVYNGTTQYPRAYFEFGGAKYYVSTDNTNFVNAGTHTITATNAGSGNFKLDSNITANISRSFTIKKVEINVGELVWGNTEFEYNGGEQKPTATYTFNGEGGTEMVSVTVTVNKTAVNAADDYIATATLVHDNFKLVGAHTKNYSIAKREITSLDWVGESFVYNGGVQKPTATFTYNGEGGAETVSVTVVVDGNAIDVRDYTATATLEHKNFKLASNLDGYSYEITPLEIAVLTWDYETYEYDGNEHYPQAFFTFNSKQISVTTEASETAKEVGSYSIVATGISDSNFKLASSAKLPHNYTITKRIINKEDVIWSPKTFEYDGQPHCPTATYVYNGITVDILFDDPNTIDAGTHTIEATAVSNSNFVLGSAVECEYTIKPRTIGPDQDDHIEWNHLGSDVTYKGTEWEITADYIDPVVGSRVSLTFNIDKTPIDVGTYTATVTGVQNNTNYEVVGTIQKVFTIHERGIDISVGFDMNTFQFTFTLDGAIDGDDVGVSYKLFKQDENEAWVEVDKIDGPGYYEVRFVGFTGADADNYFNRGDEVLEFEEITQDQWDEVTGGSDNDQGNN